MERLTAAKVRSLSTPGRYKADPTLYLNIAPGGTKSWIQRLVVNGRRRDLGLGSVELVPLAKARVLALANRTAVANGEDPTKQKAKTPTFKQAAERTIAAHQPRWRNPKTTTNWRGSLQFAYPVFGDRLVNEITGDDVLRALTPIWSTKSSRARSLRGCIRSIFAWCRSHGYIVGDNPAGECLDGALPAMPAVREHFRSLDHGHIAAALDVVNTSSSSPTVKLCMAFLILTCTRSGEARGARWNEIDLDAATWTLPASRMKSNREHRIPLSRQPIEILDAAQELRDDSGLVFPSPATGRPLDDKTLTKCLKAVGLSDLMTIHGCRRTFRNWCADSGQPRELAEAALAHTVGGVEGSYFTSDMIDRRRELMDAWADYIA